MKGFLDGKTAHIMNLSIEDELFVNAAKKLKLNIVATSSLDPVTERQEARASFPDITFYELPSAYDRRVSPLAARILNQQEINRIKKHHKSEVSLKTPRYLETNLWVLKLAERVPLIRKKWPLQSLHWNKALYLETLSKNGILVPKILQVVPDHEDGPKNNERIPFPCICKPAYCSGGFGVMIANNREDLDFLFGPEKSPHNFTDLNIYYRNKNERGLRNYIYNSGHLGGPYIIQEYVKGRVLSVSGVVVEGKATSLFSYEIGSTENRYCAEQSFQWPLEEQLERDLATISQKLTQVLKYPSGPFMLDAILAEDGKLFIIDAAPRASITGAQLSLWAHENDHHALNIISSHWNFLAASENSNHGRAIFWQRFPFKKGAIEEITYPDFSQKFIVHVETPLKKGDQINEARLDRQMVERGALVTTGENLELARKNWYEIFDGIQLRFK